MALSPLGSDTGLWRKMRRTIRTMPLACVTLLAMSGAAVSIAAQATPNIVFFISDDCTKWDLGCYGSPDAKTPTIDALAARGMRFTQCYQQASMCSPTRHSIHTGMYPVRSGAYPNHTYADQGVKSVWHYLKPLGYRVAMSGKRHIEPQETFNYEYIDGSATAELNPDFTKVDAFLADAKAKSSKFCLFICSTEPHSPWNKGDQSLFDRAKIKLPPYLADTELTRTNFRNYLAEINFMDGQVKQALDLLSKHELDDNTVFVFVSEQGNSFPFAKWTCYNAGLSSGLIVTWPGVITPGSSCDALVEYVDLLPTFIELAGGEPVDNLDGFSMVPLLKQATTTHKQYTYGMQTTRGIIQGSDYFPIRTVSDGTFRLILNLAPDMAFQNTVTQGDAFFKEWVNSTNTAYNKLADRYIHRPAVELFNDDTDPYNLVNLATDPQYAQKVTELKTKLLEWMAYCGDAGIDTELKAFQHQDKNIDKQIAARKLLFYFPFDGSLRDSTANKYTLQATGGSTYAAGKFGQAVELDGSSQYLDLTVGNILDPAAAQFTACAWVHNSSTVTPANGDHLENILAQLDGPSGEVGRIFAQTSINSSGTTGFKSFVGSGAVTSSPGVFKRNEWMHIAVLGDPLNQTLSFYVNGVKDTTRPSVAAFETCSGGFRIGGQKTGYRNFWSGKIDELYLFQGLLSAEEINRVKDNTWFDVTATRGGRPAAGVRAAGDLSIRLEPARSRLTVNGAGQIRSIGVYALSGRKLLEITNSATVDIAALLAGTYIVRVETAAQGRGGRNVTSRVFVKN